MVKSQIPDSERENAKVVPIPIIIGTGIHTFKYFEDYKLKRDAEIGQKGRLWDTRLA